MYSNSGSYHFETAETEIDRLNRQAAIFFDEEYALLKEMGLSPKDRFVDAGCGPGLVLQLLADRHDGDLIGYEVNPEFVSSARQRCQRHSRVIVEESSVYSLSGPPEFTDFIYCRFVLSHLSDPQTAMSEFVRATKQGGTIGLLDVDDTLVSTTYRNDDFQRLLQASARAQELFGGNRYIGKALGSLMQGQELSDISVGKREWLVAESHALPLLQIYLQGRVDYLSNNEKAEFNSLTEEIFREISLGKASATIGIRFASARKR